MMFRNILCAVAIASAFPAGGALAQEVINRGTPRTPNDMASPGHAAFAARRDQGNANREYLDHAARTRPPSRRSQEAMQETARRLLGQTAVTCDVVEAYDHGEVRRRHNIYEVDCAAGNGYLLLEDDPVQVFDCAAIARAAAQVRATDPRADVGTQCTLPGNRNEMASAP